MNMPPPVLGNLDVKTAVVKYQSYDDYFNTYYPLLLSEIWAVISSDARCKSKHGGSHNQRL